MENQVSVSYERWDQSGGYQEDLFESVSLDRLTDLILSIHNQYTATLGLCVNENTMDIAVSKGLYSVGCQLSNEHKYFLLLGDVTERRTIDYVVGGQLVQDYPLKYIVNVDDAVKHASQFYTAGTINCRENSWELYVSNKGMN